jgi:hypothetical protein
MSRIINVEPMQESHANDSWLLGGLPSDNAALVIVNVPLLEEFNSALMGLVGIGMIIYRRWRPQMPADRICQLTR